VLEQLQKMRPREAAKYTRIAVSTLAKLRCYGGGPPFSKVASRIVIYDKGDLDVWLARELRGSTSDPGLNAR
jgi:hypothetical protein